MYEDKKAVSKCSYSYILSLLYDIAVIYSVHVSLMIEVIAYLDPQKIQNIKYFESLLFIDQKYTGNDYVMKGEV